MVSGDNVTVTLTGGGPWGFRLTGGGSLPLQIAKIRKKSQAHSMGLKEGDAVVSINGIPVHDRTHDEAVDLLDTAGDTLTLQIYRGDADDLGRLLASKKTPGPILTPQDEGDLVVTSSSNLVTSSSNVQDDGSTRREVQENVFVTSEGDTQSSTFVRREHTVTTSSSYGDVNGNDVGGGLDFSATVELSAPLERPKSLSPAPPVSPKPSLSPHPPSSPRPLSPQPTKFSPAVSPQPTFSPQPAPTVTAQLHSSPLESKPSGPTWVPRPTFKAVPPKVAPSVAPKPVLGPPVAPKPQVSAKPSFNAKAAPQPFSPVKFQVSATAMYSQQPYSPTTNTPPQPYSQASHTFSSASQSYSQPAQPYSPEGQQQFSPQQTYSQSSRQRYSRQTSSKQVYTPGSQQPYSPGNQPFSPASQPFSPMSVSSPMSPSQPFSPLSPGAPMFNVRNNFGDGKNVWQPNLWLPGQDPDQQRQRPQQQQRQQSHPQQEHHNENIEVPKRMSVKERQQLLLTQTSRTKHSLSARQADPDFDAPPEEVQRAMATGRHPHNNHHHHHKPHVFGPPVEITPEGPLEDLGLIHSEESDSSSAAHRKKKVYSDSAFYADPTKNYPTIEEQMKLCRLISHSLTSAANRRARGAKMFAKRKKTSSKWVHEGHSEWSSSAGDVANLDELDSELDWENGGHRPLFAFRIPNVKQRVSSPDRNTKMSLKKDEFERLRLQAQKCDHKTVSPGQCFDIVADLKASKGRGGRLFERRKNRADKFIIDESNAKLLGPKHTRLEGMLHTPLKSRQSPWEAAQSDKGLDAAFGHLDERERLDKLNRILQYNPSKPKPAAAPPRDALVDLNPPPLRGPKTNLKGGSTVHLLEGRNFNRYAKGWHAGGDDYNDRASSLLVTSQQQAAPPVSQEYPPQSAPQAPRAQYGDYNPRPKAWQPGGVGGDSVSCPASMSASWNSSDFDSYQQNGYGGPAYYLPEELPACDL